MVSGVLRLLVWQHAKFQNPAVWACPSMCSGCGHSPPLHMSAMSSCFQLSRFRELGKKIVGTGRTYRFAYLLIIAIV